MSVISCRLCKLTPTKNPDMTYEAITLSLDVIEANYYGADKGSDSFLSEHSLDSN